MQQVFVGNFQTSNKAIHAARSVRLRSVCFATLSLRSRPEWYGLRFIYVERK